MPFTLSVRESIALNGITIDSRSAVTADGCLAKDIEVPAAKTGTLTTRTDANTGTLTMSSGHGFTDGDRLDVYWDGGSRRGMTVGTVSTNSVPIDGGAGDDLPSAATAITAMVPVEEALAVTGNNVSGILLSSNVLGNIVVADGSDVELLAKNIGGQSNSDLKAYAWFSERDPVNPLSGDTVAKVFFSHGSSTLTAQMNASFLVS